MVDFVDVRNTLSEVFLRDDLKKTAEIIHYKEERNSDYNTKELVFDGQEVIEGIFINYNRVRKRFDPFGVYNDTSLILFVPYDTEVGTFDEIMVYNKTFKVNAIQDFVGDGTNDERLGKKVFLVQTSVELPGETAEAVAYF